MNLLEVKNITKQYANHKALDDVSISVPEQSIFGLLGPNGAGKTTLIRIINLINACDKGEIIFAGKKIKAKDTETIGYLPEERGLYKKMKVGEQALYLSRLKGVERKEATEKLKFWFEKFDLLRWWNRKVEELSKGMQQKVQFIVTIIHEPKLLIFDEPFSGFDPINTELLKEEILKLRDNGATVIFSTHNMASVEEICDHIALINKSKKILDGNVKTIKNEYKSNIFELGISGIENELKGKINPAFNILSQIRDDELTKYKIKIPHTSNPNELLKEVIPFCSVTYLNEIIPNMNEIFIRAVGENN